VHYFSSSHFLLGEAFAAIVTEANKLSGGKENAKFAFKGEIKAISEGFQTRFIEAWDNVRRRKLGFAYFSSSNVNDLDMWNKLENLLFR